MAKYSVAVASVYRPSKYILCHKRDFRKVLSDYVNNLMKTKIDNIIGETMDDINAYLESDVPLECYQKDIDRKLQGMREEVAGLIPTEKSDFLRHARHVWEKEGKGLPPSFD